ncbi:MAG: DUF6329 domain-containing protein [Eubacterium sp.]|nr:DUF6329 domain-containing protein [Eubacterium sp.]
MADKLILNVDLNYKTAEFSPEQCVVEKVIEVSESEFKKFCEKPMQPNYYLAPYKSLMGFYDESYHCVMMVNEQNGDGLLINTEGANYARYSQYIPNAKDIIQSHEQSLALDDLKTHMDSCINDWLEQHKNEEEICVSMEEFLNDSNLTEILADYVSEALSAHPQIDVCFIGNGFVEAERKELTETKLYCPLKFEMSSSDGSEPYEVYSEDYVNYDEDINDIIDNDVKIDEESAERGLAAYFHDEHLDKKVHSIFPSVEVRNGDLYGVFTVKSYGELDKAELIDVSEFASSQAADGWGEGFEQRDIWLGEDNVYISFWSSDSNYFMKPESEIFPEQNLEQTMGGMA